MAIIDHIHDRKSDPSAWRELLDWSFHAKDLDKRLARMALVVWGVVSVLAAVAFLVINLL